MTQVQAIDPKTTRRPAKQSKAERILSLKASNPKLTERQIAALTDSSKTNVHVTLQRYGLSQENIDNYVANRAKILQGLQDKILSTIDPDDLKKTPAAQRTMMFGILYDKERLETGKSTQNVQGIYHILSEIERSERKEVVSNSDIDAQSGKPDTTDSIDIGVDNDAL